MPQQEQFNKENLDEARRIAGNLHRKVNPNPSSKKIVKAGISEFRRISSLMKNFDPFLDWLFGIALALAMLKDILDFVGFGSLPLIGTVITLCVSFAIGLIMFVTGSRGVAKAARGIMKRFAVLSGGTLGEMVFGLNFFPIETAIVIFVFYMTLYDRAKDKEKQEKEKQASQQVQQQAPAQGTV